MECINYQGQTQRRHDGRDRNDKRQTTKPPASESAAFVEVTTFVLGYKEAHAQEKTDCIAEREMSVDLRSPLDSSLWHHMAGTRHSFTNTLNQPRNENLQKKKEE